MKSAASLTCSVSAEMHSPSMSPTVAAFSMVGIEMVSKDRVSTSRSSGTRSRKPAIIASLPRLNSCRAVASRSSSALGVSVGSRRIARVWSSDERVLSSEKASDVGSSSSSKTSPPPE